MPHRRSARARLERTLRRHAPLAFLPLAFACSDPAGLGDRLHPTGSQTLATSADRAALYVASEAEGTVARVVPATGAVSRVDVGVEPSRVARVGGTIFVSLAAERAIAVLEDVGGELRVVGRIEVGAEPTGLVASEDGTRLYVAETTQGRVSELDPAARAILRSWAVEGQPRGLALHPSGRALFVTSSFGARLWRVDLGADGAPAQRVALPEVGTFGEKGEVVLEGRFTGDPAITPDGEQLLVPGLWVDAETEVTEPAPGAPIEEIPPGTGYDRTGRFNPVVVAVPLDEEGTPAPAEVVEMISVATFNGGPLVSYPTSVTVEPSGELALVTMEGAGGVVAMAVNPPPDSGPGFLDVLFGGGASDQAVPPPGRGVALAFRATGAIGTDRGPNGVAMLGEDRAFVSAFLARTVAPIEVRALRGLVGLDRSGGDGPVAVAAPVPLPGGGGERFFPVSAGPSITVETSGLPAAVERGRQLFFAADDPTVASVSAGVSCGTCHAHGRNDGLTWRFARGPRQTPSLAGKVSETEPVGWGGEKATVAVDAMATSQGLMGGRGMTESHAADLAAFIDHVRDADVPLRGVSPERDPGLARGQALFEREDVGCVSCHSGARFTDNRTHDLAGLGLQTPTLVGVAVTAPYLHDGSAPTLRDVLRDLSHDGASTVQLADDELADLARYVESL